jgi:sulfate adenylyltransferase subunit 1 (EFTu-like GTPase family)
VYRTRLLKSPSPRSRQRALKCAERHLQPLARAAAEETVAVAPSGRRVRVESIVGCDGQVQDARAGDAITLTLAEEADLARGDVLSSPDRQPSTSSGFAARIVWFAPEPLLPGRSYLVRIGTAMVPRAVTGIRHRIEPGTLRPVGADTLDRNDIAHAISRSSVRWLSIGLRTTPSWGPSS